MKKMYKILYACIITLLAFGGVAFAASETMKWDDNGNPMTGAITDDSNLETRNLRVDPVTNALLITSVSTPAAATDYFDGRQVVGVPGTAVKIASASTVFIACDIQSEESNTGDVMIGASTVDETPATARGTRLIPGSNYHIERPGDLQYIYIDAEIATDGVTFFCQK